MSNEALTPRVDAILEMTNLGWDQMIDFARQLEMELAAKAIEYEQLSAAYSSLSRAYCREIPNYDYAYSFKDNLKRYELGIMAPLNAALAECRKALQALTLDWEQGVQPPLRKWQDAIHFLRGDAAIDDMATKGGA